MLLLHELFEQMKTKHKHGNYKAIIEKKKKAIIEVLCITCSIVSGGKKEILAKFPF